MTLSDDGHFFVTVLLPEYAFSFYIMDCNSLQLSQTHRNSQFKWIVLNIVVVN